MTVRVVREGEGHCRWVDVVEPSEAELRGVARKFGLHSTSVRDCLDPEHLPKFERFPRNLFVILRVYDAEAGEESSTVHELTRKLALFVGGEFVVTIHRKELPFLEPIVDRWKTGRNGDGETPEVQAQHLALDIVTAGLSTYEPPLDRIEEGIDRFEEALFSGEQDADDLLQLYRLRRRAMVMKRMLWRSHEMLQRIVPTADTMIPHYTDVKEHAEGMHFFADELTDYATNLTGLQLALASQKTNLVMRILTVFSAFFLPLTFIVGVYGMNFAHMPELPWRFGYLMVWAVMLLVTLAIWVWFRSRGWLKL
jgi:magnesium transporter